MSPQARVIFGWALLLASLVGWPVTAMTIAKGEPFVVLSLSWFALILTAIDIAFTADVHKEQEGDSQ